MAFGSRETRLHITIHQYTQYIGIQKQNMTDSETIHQFTWRRSVSIIIAFGMAPAFGLDRGKIDGMMAHLLCKIKQVTRSVKPDRLKRKHHFTYSTL
jgi:hypothetical protein